MQEEEKTESIQEPIGKTQRYTVRAVKRHWMTLAFVFGFLLDNITLNRVDQTFLIM